MNIDEIAARYGAETIPTDDDSTSTPTAEENGRHDHDR